MENAASTNTLSRIITSSNNSSKITPNNDTRLGNVKNLAANRKTQQSDVECAQLKGKIPSFPHVLRKNAFPFHKLRWDSFFEKYLLNHNANVCK
jgi:hypothetical protein